jgi:CRISPR type III-A-associated RAMP protein Csm4
MKPALLIRLRPTTPWRIGPGTGARNQAGAVLHSDTWYSAVCQAMAQFQMLEEWLNATARPFAEPAVRFSSLFPFQRGMLYAPPPAGIWPPPQSGRVRWKGAKLAPLGAIGTLLRGETLDEERWIVDGHSGCLLPSTGYAGVGPFRQLRRRFAAVDRLTGGLAEPYEAAAVQFAPGCGLWGLMEFANPTAYAVWAPKIEIALRWLADSGVGGWRSRGFGRARQPEMTAGTLEQLLEPLPAPKSGSPAWWLLSLFSPGDEDQVDWSAGNYELVTRTGRAVNGAVKTGARLVEEGSVLVAPAPPRGSIRDVGPEGAGHPVYRAGYALALPIDWGTTA